MKIKIYEFLFDLSGKLREYLGNKYVNSAITEVRKEQSNSLRKNRKAKIIPQIKKLFSKLSVFEKEEK